MQTFIRFRRDCAGRQPRSAGSLRGIPQLPFIFEKTSFPIGGRRSRITHHQTLLSSCHSGSSGKAWRQPRQSGVSAKSSGGLLCQKGIPPKSGKRWSNSASGRCMPTKTEPYAMSVTEIESLLASHPAHLSRTGRIFATNDV